MNKKSIRLRSGNSVLSFKTVATAMRPGSARTGLATGAASP
jgi:hypothetical protein